MGDVRAFVLAIGAVLIGLGLLLGWINYKIDKLKEEDKLNIDMIGSIIALEKAMKKLNAALKIHEHRLDHERDEIYGINKRLDILEEGHPDTDIDYGEVDDHGEVVCVWFEGKKYVPEDKRDENTSTFYADNKVVAETHCCATCQHYRPDSGFSTCEFSSWLHVTKKYATMSDSACNKYVSSGKDKVEYIRYDRMYRDMGGNGKAEQVEKQLDDLRCKLQRLDLIASLGGCTSQEMRQRWEELMRDDT